ncbi:solute carrier organic anion transporter family member 4C1-like isoform X2 [Clavelina lepadiformis]|uniref:solute carrier organic anion transporter family member 4C1-like isoform X2 n=1 Tax=Clavelina lepadiformis TaxID=159417 RepID=UPI0040431D2D
MDKDLKPDRAAEEDDYSLFYCKPKFLQCCNNAKGFLVIYSIFAIVAGSMVGGITNTNIAALERRFGLDSSQSAIIVVSYDIAFCILTVFVTYFGARSHVPRLIAAGAILFGAGALVYAIPHFTTDLYNFVSVSLVDTCNITEIECSLHEGDDSYNMYILLFGQVLMGCGTTPLYTLGIAFIENSVPKNVAPIYIGIANACSLFGPVIGFTSGGAFLSNYYVDFDTVNNISPNPDDPRWVGAWWIGPLIMMVLCWCTVIPFAGFPKQLPGTAKYRAERQSEIHQTVDLEQIEKRGSQNTIRNFPFAIKSLLKNLTYVLIILAGCASGGAVSGATSFLSKFIQNEFHITAGNAAIYAGAVLVPGAAAGHIVGGVCISQLKWKTPSIIVYCLILSFLACLLSPSMLLYCENIKVAGVTASYGSDRSSLVNVNLTAPCNAPCSCQNEFYKPVCGADDLTYFSPCHAGCHSSLDESEYFKLYSNCSCVASNAIDNNSKVLDTASTATSGFCENSCENVKIFLPLIFFLAFIVFQTHTAATVITFRIVPESLRCLAVGLAWLFFRALGTIPGPIMFGKLTDQTCILWQVRRCDGSRGSCWIYDSANMGLTFMILVLVGHLLALICYGLMVFAYKPPLPVESDRSADEDRKPQCTEKQFDNPIFVHEDILESEK